MDNMIQTTGLTKAYGQYQAVNNVSISINKGDIYGLIGRNGAGKTTLFKLLMGLTLPTGGEISIMGSSSSKAALNHTRKNMGFMMGTNFFGYLNAYDNMKYACKLKGITDKNEITRVLKLVDLDTVKKPFKSFSMGMRQRLAVAYAMLGNPDIIILDEPTNGLDPQGIVDFRKMILKLNVEQGLTFIISSHILGELGQLGTKFGFIEKGLLISEIDAQTLHDVSRQAVIIKVDDVNKACTIIEEKLKTTDYKVNAKQEIIIDDFIDRADEIARVLVDAKLKLTKLQPVEISLEEYFLALIGGTENV